MREGREATLCSKCSQDSPDRRGAACLQRDRRVLGLAGECEVVRLFALFGLTRVQDLSEEGLDFVEAVFHARCNPTLDCKRSELPLAGFGRRYER